MRGFDENIGGRGLGKGRNVGFITSDLLFY
jgi:hypothetical protein